VNGRGAAEKAQLEIAGQNTAVGKAGSEYRICDEIRIANQSGKAKLTVSAKSENGETYEINTDDYTFVPMRKGKYTVTAVCEDYIRTTEKSFEITVEPNDKPQIFDTPALPKYFILGARYALPELEGFDFGTGEPIARKAAISVREDGGDEVAVRDGVYRVRAEKTVRVIYTVTAGEEQTSIYRDIPVVDVGYGAELDYAAYFKTTSGSIEKLRHDLDIEIITRTDKSSAEFVNALIADGFEFSFNINGNKNKFSRLDVYFEDSVSKDESLKLSFTRGSGGVAFASLNDGQTYNLTSNFNGTGDNFFVGYNDSSSTVRLSPSFGIPVNAYISGQKFDGFTSGKVYMRIEFGEVTGDSAINVFNLNGTSFAEFDTDYFAPTISCNDMRGNKGVGDTVTLLPAIAADVLDPDVVFTLRVTGPDEKPVTSEEGVLLDGTCNPNATHTVRFDDYGVYMVEYEAHDTEGNSVSISYGISVVDTVAPVITLKDGYTVSAAKGDVVNIAEYTVSDDRSENLEVYVYIVSPFGNIYRLQENAFEAVASGKYTVLITVSDENNNFAMAQYNVTVA